MRMRRSWFSAVIVVTLERSPNLGTGAVEQHSLVRVGHVERLADLRGRPAENVTHREDFSLIRWEVFDGSFDDLERLCIECAVLGIVPGLRWTFPLPATSGVEAFEPPRVDRGFGAGHGVHRERDRAALLGSARARNVEQDPVEPRLDARALLETA